MNRRLRKLISYGCTLLCLAVSVSTANYAQQPSLAGDWSGESLCAGTNPSCHDEHVVYHISVDFSDGTKVNVSADKIVDGKLEWMGNIPLKYDPAKQTLTGDLQSPRYKGIWEFTVKGNIIEGTLSLFTPEKTVGRRIRVQKNGTSQKESSTVTQHAAGSFDVKLSPQDDKSDDKSMGRMTIEKQWHGAIEGTSRGQMLTGGDPSTGSATYVAIEKFTGAINGRKGTLLFQHMGTVNRGVQDLNVSVVPDSGTDQLKGITGRLTGKIEGGKHLYDFEYTIH
jgi:hypothetical protein